jgi:hypothetical protein
MDNFILEAAIEGLEAEKIRINATIERIRQMMGAKPVGKASGNTKATPKAKGKKRTMSAAGRAAVKAGQKKRWAAFHKAQKKGGKK